MVCTDSQVVVEVEQLLDRLQTLRWHLHVASALRLLGILVSVGAVIILAVRRSRHPAAKVFRSYPARTRRRILLREESKWISDIALNDIAAIRSFANIRVWPTVLIFVVGQSVMFLSGMHVRRIGDEAKHLGDVLAGLADGATRSE